MYERFTDHARRILKTASEEAERLGHDELTAEHLLLGLLQDGEGAASTVLKNLNLDVSQIRRELPSRLQSGSDGLGPVDSPPSHSSAKVIELAIEEARRLNHMYVGTEHIMLGILAASDSTAARLLNQAGLTADEVRAEVRKLIGEGFGS